MGAEVGDVVKADDGRWSISKGDAFHFGAGSYTTSFYARYD